MTFTEQQQRGQEILDTIIRKSWEDEGFKQELITNPIETFEKFTGTKVKEKFKIVTEDQSDDRSLYFNIPAKPNLDELELTEEELEMISGGDGPGYDLGYYVANKVIDGIQWIGDQFTR